MGVGDNPVGEMGDPLDDGKGLKRTLEAGQEIPDKAGEDKLTADIRRGCIPAGSAHGEPEIDQHRHDRDEHADAPGYRHDFEPGGGRRLQQVMGAYVSIDHQDRPEPDEG